MSISAQRFATKTRTWLFIAGPTALPIGIGALIGGMFLYVLVALAAIAERVRGSARSAIGRFGSLPSEVSVVTVVPDAMMPRAATRAG